MGKKYIIELPENTHWIQWLMEGTEDHHPYMDFKSVEDLTPYTEPDLEQVRKEAYRQGYDTGYSTKVNEFYEQGLADAWDAARKIVTMTDRGFINSDILDLDPGESIFTKYTASEAIAKIKEYEEYHVGDEFENGAGQKFVVLKMDGKEIDRYIDGDGKTYVMTERYKVMRKTGRHFPEIAAVLEKMRGEQE